ncbi:MAG: hypothetical protein OHK006_12120 [Thermodesulfovibrionales bacterium]
MAGFRDREEYERWKAAREEALRAKTGAAGQTPGAAGQDPGASEASAGLGHAAAGLSGEITPIDQLLNGSWMIYRRRAGVLIGLSLFSALVSAVLFIIIAGAGFLLALADESLMVPFLAAGATTGALAGIIVFCWGQAATVLAVTDESLGFPDALAAGWRRLWDFIWLYSAAGFIIIGGFMLFIVPGVLLAIFFSFSQFILAEGREKGMRSLLLSRECVRGLWGQVFLRLLVVWLISMAVGSVPLAGPILSILAMPFSTVYAFLTYESVKMVKGPVSFDDSAAAKAKWIGIGVAGHAVQVVILILLWHAIKGLCPPLTEGLTSPPF